MKKSLKPIKAQMEVFRDEIEKMGEEGKFLVVLLDVFIKRINKGDFDGLDQKQGKT